MSEAQKNITLLSEKFFRPESRGKKTEMNFLFHNGGIGDYICGVPALEYIAENHTNVQGRVYTLDVTVDLFKHFLRKYPHWTVEERSLANKPENANRPTFSPELRPINALGCHLLDLGFIYYAGINPVPEEYNRYPKLDLSDIDMPVPSHRYAVMTPGATTPNRTLGAKAFNGIKKHLLENGITPVFLGKKTITPIRHISFNSDYDFEGGVDLSDQTSLLQAAALISKATLIVGLDNGLLHLAACTETPIIFGYNVSGPIHRRPRRASGNIWDIYPDPKVLSCTFCQGNMRFSLGHDFAKCLYKDNKCLELLDDAKLWTDAIDHVLGKP